MNTLLSFIEGIVGIVGSFIGAMTPPQLSAFMSAVGRWVRRIDLFLSPDVQDPPTPSRPPRRRRGRSAR